MEYSEYQRYRQQLQSRDSNTSENTDNTVVTLKHQNPSIEAAEYERDHNASIELRQRVRIRMCHLLGDHRCASAHTFPLSQLGFDQLTMFVA